MTEPFLGEIQIVGFSFAPKGWASCDGQLLAIQQNTALFSILGTTYGGNGVQTFALPDLRGRAPLSWGNGAGLSPYSLGESTGTSTVTLSTSQLPQHNHLVKASSALAITGNPTGNVLGAGNVMYENATSFTAGSAGSQAGSGQPHNNMPPYLTLLFCIALQGIFPSRN